MKASLIYSYLLSVILLSGCDKEEKNNPGTFNPPNNQDTSYVELNAILEHHGVNIPSQLNYPDTLFIKHHTFDFPGDSVALYDTFCIGIPGDIFIKVKFYEKDSMFFWATGLDTFINDRVKGGIPYNLSFDTGKVSVVIPVTED